MVFGTTCISSSCPLSHTHIIPPIIVTTGIRNIHNWRHWGERKTLFALPKNVFGLVFYLILLYMLKVDKYTLVPKKRGTRASPFHLKWRVSIWHLRFYILTLIVYGVSYHLKFEMFGIRYTFRFVIFNISHTNMEALT